MENIVRIEELSDFVNATLTEINRGVAAARADGLVCDLPKEVQFSVLVVKEFQALELQGAVVSESVETQGGGSTETSTGEEKQQTESSGKSTASKKGRDQTDGEDAHDQQDEETYEYSE